MKNVSNPYGYYLTEDFETIELRGNFEKNHLFLPTKNPDEQLNYKVFVSPKKNINFGIQIVGGSNPTVVYIPQHIYKELQLAYSENNPYYTIKDITVVKLDFTDSGNALIKYLKQKFESAKDGLSRLAKAGVTSINNYAGFQSNEQPDDELILKQILFLFDEENDIIFVDKNVELVTEDIVKQRGYINNRIKGDFNYTSNYFDGSGKFISSLLNSEANIKLEDNTSNSINALNDFVKDYAGKSLTEVNSIYKSNITISTSTTNAPKLIGQIMSGLAIATPLVKMGLDKLSQLKQQKALKQAEEAKSLANKGLSNLENMGDNAVSSIESGVSNVISIFKKPVIPQLSIKIPPIAKVKPKFNKFKIKASVESAKSIANQAQSAVNTAQSAAQSAAFTVSSAANQAQSIAAAASSTATNIAGAASSAIGKVNSISTISTIGNVGLTEGLNMIKNAATQTVDSLKSTNADFLKGN